MERIGIGVTCKGFIVPKGFINTLFGHVFGFSLWHNSPIGPKSPHWWGSWLTHNWTPNTHGRTVL